jgi:flavin-binding protein dodecin
LLLGKKPGDVEERGMHIENGKVAAYRARVKISFKYEGE